MELFKKRNLFDIFDIKIGGDVKNINHSKEKTEIYKYPVYSNGVTDEGLFFYSDSYKIEETSITISARGTIGACFYREGKYTSIGRLISLIAKDTNLTNEKYYYYLLNKTKLIPADGVVKSLTKPMLKEVNLYEPKKEEQDKIVNVLDKQQSLIDSYKEKFSLLEEQELYYQDELLSGRIRIKLNSENEKMAIDKGFIINGELVEGKEKEFEEWLSVDFKDKVEFYKEEDLENILINDEKLIKPKNWIIKNIMEISDFKNGYSFNKKTYTNEKNDFEIIEVGSITINGEYNKKIKNKKFVNREIIKELDKYKLEINNIVIPMSDMSHKKEHVGTPYLIDKENFYLNQRVGAFFNIKIDVRLMFLNLFTNQKYFSINSTGQGPYNLSTATIKDYDLVIPNNNVEIKCLINFLFNFKNQKKLIKEKIKIEEEKMDFLMDELLSGRIRVE